MDQQVADEPDSVDAAEHEAHEPSATDHSHNHLSSPASKYGWPLAVVALLVIAAVTHELRFAALIISIVIIVMVHEFGHYLTAKSFGMKVTEYFLGFGQRVWSFRKGETEYGVKVLPAGGYVRIIGMNNLEDVDPADEARTYRQHPIWQRLIVVCAGSFMHFVMAFILAFCILVFIGQEIDQDPTTTVASLTDVSASPAKAAGVKVGDKVVSVNGVPTTTWNDVTGELVRVPVGQPVAIGVIRNGSPLTLNVTPVDRRSAKLPDGSALPATNPNQAVAFVGISPVPGRVDYKKTSPGAAIPKVSSQLWRNSGSVFAGFGKMFSPSGLHTYYQNVTGTLPKAKEASAAQSRPESIVGIGIYAHDAAKSGWISSLSLLYALNLFFGIFNMIPLLPFDGGHAAIAIYEKIRSIGRPRYYVADAARMIPVMQVVLLLLAVLTISAMWLDVIHPPTNPYQ